MRRNYYWPLGVVGDSMIVVLQAQFSLNFLEQHHRHATLLEREAG